MTPERVLASCLATEDAAQLWAHSWPWLGGQWGQGQYRARRALCGWPGTRCHPWPHCPSPRCASPGTAAVGEQNPISTIPQPLPALHPPAQGWDIQFLFPFPALQSCCDNGKGSLCSPRSLGSPSPAFPRLGCSSPSQPLRNHHLIQLHLARHRWGGGSLHPARCWTAGFLYHLQGQPQLSLQSDPRARAALPGSAPSLPAPG